MPKREAPSPFAPTILSHYMLTISTPAPTWSALDHDGKKHSSSDYAGKWMLIYFYPMDDTPGCTLQACGLRDHFVELKKHLTILGVSADSAESHQQFRSKYNLPFPLLADADKTLIELFGAKGMLFGKRVSFLIDPTGIIRKIYTGIECTTHANEVLKDIQELAK